MNTNNNIILNRVFSQNTFINLIETHKDETYISSVKKYVTNSESKTNRELINELYSFLGKKHRNEYFYKNTILNKLILGKHSINTTTALSEVPIGRSKADFVLINGKAIVYEIKTELDNLDRLEKQLIDYYKVFDHVCVLTHESNCCEIYKKFRKSHVGLCVLSNQNTIKTYKEPTADRTELDTKLMFKMLRKYEYERIIKCYYEKLPTVSQFCYYKTCLGMFCDLGIDDAYSALLKELKKRSSIYKNEYSRVPYELKALVYFSQYKKENYEQLEEFLEGEFGG